MFKQHAIRFTRDIISWLLLGTVIGVPIGLASALFLYSLDFVSHWRESNLWIIIFTPLVGLLIGYIYSNLGKSSESGTNLILQEYFIPSKTLPKLMAPLILVNTLLSHLVGASAGREGTAIQMGAAIADRFHFLGEKFQQNRALFLTAGIGAGFASLFGTPWAGAMFAIELLRSKSIPWSGVIPALISSFVAYFTCLLTKAPHTHYKAVEGLQFYSTTLIYLFAVSALFGMVALLYVYAHQFFKSLGVVLVRSNIWRPFFGGIVIFIIFAIMGNTRFMGLGIPSILDSFENHAAYYDFMVKLLLTAFTLAFDFKGGEVTPLFFIGATLGSALSLVVPIPIALMTAMGFLAVFAGATKTFMACSIMGVELFGWEAFPYFFTSCLVAQIFSGRKGIYENLNNPISLFKSKL